MKCVETNRLYRQYNYQKTELLPESLLAEQTDILIILALGADTETIDEVDSVPKGIRRQYNKSPLQFFS